MRQYIKPFLLHKDTIHLVYTSTALLLFSKGLAIASPYILKLVVDAMAVPGAIDFKILTTGILVGGLTRVLSSVFSEMRMI